MLLIFVGSSFSKLPEVPGGFSDKTLHAGEYAVLGVLFARGLAGPRWLSLTFPHVAGAVILAALYGVSDEFHQLFVFGRQFDVSDMMADGLGASLSTGALWAWGIIRRFCGH
jgi:VanZ family protein